MEIKVTLLASNNRTLLVKEKGKYRIYVRNPAKRNLANREMIGIISKEFTAPIKAIRIISGHKTKNKTVLIDENYTA